MRDTNLRAKPSGVAENKIRDFQSSKRKKITDGRGKPRGICVNLAGVSLLESFGESGRRRLQFQEVDLVA